MHSASGYSGSSGGRAMRLVAAALIAAACDSALPTEPYDLDFDPANFVVGVTNPLFPLVPGTTFSFAGDTEDGRETILVEVLDQTRNVQGITAAVVRDRVYLDGSLIEDTYDWYAQDTDGNVWYLGEDSKEIEDGRVVSTAGSWEAGVDGALPGIIMWADPAAHVGEEYFQEYFPGTAMDKGKVVAVNLGVQVPAGSFTGCVETEDWNPLEPGVTERKFYCPNLGFVKEMKVRGGNEVVELTQVTRP